MKLAYFSILILFISTVFTGCLGTLGPEPEIYINEFLASNNGTAADPLKHKEVDWIELYNSYDLDVDIGGYYLTDNKDDTTKWKFPSGTIINAKGYLVVWADGSDTLLHTNFKLSRSEEEIALYSKDKELLDFVKFKDQQLNISYGRKWDGIEKWVYYDNPSPNSTNILQKGVKKINIAEQPEFSLDAGFYDTTVFVSLAPPTDNSQIRYTINGNIPTRGSKLYTKPIEVNKTTVIRAITIEKKKLASKTVTRTYFINVDKNLPVVSLVADANALWDTVDGIYEKSIKGEYRLANVEFFENQDEVINQFVKMSISGNVARFHGQKAILLEASENLGAGTLDHRFFPNKRIYSFKSILLRAGGHPDKYNTMFIDGIVQYITDKHLEVDYMAYRPSVVYLNGKYWGIYNLREKLNSNYFVDNYSLDDTKLDLLENSWAVANDGDNRHYLETRDFIKECDKTNPLNYEHVKSLIDVNNYIDYNICEIHASNIDWPNWNIKFWKHKGENALWRWVLVDLDYGYGVGTKVNYDMIGYAASPVKTRVTNPPSATVFFRKMLEFPEFRNEFIQRFAASLNVIYSPERVLKIISEFEEERRVEMPAHIDRWSSSYYKSPWGIFRIPTSMEKWDAKIEVMRDFARKRPDFVRKNLIEKFHLQGMVNITTNSNGGNITINTIKLDEGKQEGKYFKNIPMRMEGIPNPGQQFLYWIVNGKKDHSNVLNFTPKSNGSIKAIFADAPQTELPEIIKTNTTLTAGNSPYFAIADVTINNGVILTIEKGVQLLMEKHNSIIVYGGLICNGTQDEPISITPNPYTKTTEWGALCVDNTSYPVELNHVNITAGTWYDDKPRYKATITSINSDISLNYVTVESSHFPFYSEHGTVSITNSKMTSPKTCDMINIKYASKALVENCVLPGNDYPDTDAIDYDSIHDGIIRNNTIYGFFGFNSDAIDIGEASSGVLIEGNHIFNMTDKGVSVGQKSSAIIKNNLIYGCDMGIGIKDSNSFAYIDHNIFYGNKYGVAIFEKNQNSGGGGAEISNCIFFQSKKKPVQIDNMSWVSIINSLSNNKKLDGRKNIKADPEFEDAVNFNFNLKENSPARNSATDNTLDMGVKVIIPEKNTPEIVINEVNFSPLWKNGPLYWFEIYNNSNTDVDLTGWTIKNENHYNYAFPQELIIEENRYLIITNNLDGFLWHYPDVKNVREIFDANLIFEGNTLILYNPFMNLVDYVDYNSMLQWPDKLDKTGASLELKESSLDNNKVDNWKTDVYQKGTPGSKNENK